MAEDLNIDLAQGESMNYDLSPIVKSSPVEKYYPTIRIETKMDIDFPDEGYVTFKFKKREHTEKPGAHPYFCTVLECTELCEVETEDEEGEDEESEGAEEKDSEAASLDLRGDKALDRLAEAKHKKMMEKGEY